MVRKEKTLRSEQRDATREAILEAATRLLAKQGYAALRVAAVAAEAGLSLGGHLHHFPSKESLVIAVLERLMARSMDLLEKEAARVDAEDDRLMAIARSAQRFYSAPEYLIYLDIFLSVRRNTLVGDTASKLLLSQRTATEALWLPRLIDQGISKEDAALVAHALWALARGLALSLAGTQGKAKDQATIDFVIDALKRAALGKRA